VQAGICELVAQVLAQAGGLTAGACAGDVCDLWRGDRLWGRVLVATDASTQGQVGISRSSYSRIQDEALRGLNARIAIVAPEGLLVKPVTGPAVDGWIGLKDGDPWVYFGDLVVACNPGKHPGDFLTMSEEEQPIKWIANTEPSWLEIQEEKT
jgi:hypothetical protein